MRTLLLISIASLAAVLFWAASALAIDDQTPRGSATLSPPSR
jgi:hypothetical protein